VIRILILGAGSTGLGAAYRLQELGHTEFLVLEKSTGPGGLAASFADRQGFTWDIGGHGYYSRFEYFRQVMAAVLPGGWIDCKRQSHIWMRDRFVPYPMQKNLRSLPRADTLQCVLGLLARPQANGREQNYRDWVISTFGHALASMFMPPYSEKVWAWPAEMMGASWVEDRVAPVNLEELLEDIILERENVGWGSNRTFRVPARGGNGEFWRRIAERLPACSIRYGAEVGCIETGRHIVTTMDGVEYPYDVLVSTLPLSTPGAVTRHSGVHSVGIGIRGSLPDFLKDRNWIFFPEPDCPFYRVSILSNYATAHAPQGHWSLLAEVSFSPRRRVDESTIIEDSIDGLRRTRILSSGDQVVATWHHRADYGYPTPTTDRDAIVDARLRHLEKRNIYSRGRFGAWKYEIGNQDQCFMQGVEVVNRILRNEPETILALRS
jgi:protoporphyrinogen oxidase